MFYTNLSFRICHDQDILVHFMLTTQTFLLFQTYHKTMLKIEKAKIKLQLASTPEVIMETKKKVDDLNTKVESQLEKYKLHLDKWQTKWERAEEVSYFVLCTIYKIWQR